ncbi:MAG: type II toxin-antitoxin system VapC family toxin [Candidatus Aminicenantes bacterium]|nr:type II toxin-antitoxin system VapC family toxin [Candidatus Aminicenantes bacterium]
MIGLDTNLLVRYIAQDDPGQSKKAAQEIDKALSAGEMFFIADIVICELVWVLETAYGYDRRDIAPVLENVLRTKQFQFENKDLLWTSLADYRAKKGDFADHLIGQAGHKAGCSETLTFDSGLKNNPLFRVL